MTVAVPSRRDLPERRPDAGAPDAGPGVLADAHTGAGLDLILGLLGGAIAAVARRGRDEEAGRHPA